ncbi:GNAT family N-acetyltransferase [Roseovarius pacificus]|uniref:GNAT family N-acetyltransferase n=1 Tax=Roseovarius pacificus TaxID=337701 RepID=UPI002A18E6BF|nr:GNAT family N-acetyltransferase [Roseovarius pacificus]
MATLLRYERKFENKLLTLLKQDREWDMFTSDKAINGFKEALIVSQTHVAFEQNRLSGYVRALIDEFGIYISELYVAPEHRNRGIGRSLLSKIGEVNTQKQVYVLSDEDRYYTKLGYKRIGSVFQLT